MFDRRPSLQDFFPPAEEPRQPAPNFGGIPGAVQTGWIPAPGYRPPEQILTPPEEPEMIVVSPEEQCAAVAEGRDSICEHGIRAHGDGRNKFATYYAGDDQAAEDLAEIQRVVPDAELMRIDEKTMREQAAARQHEAEVMAARQRAAAMKPYQDAAVRAIALGLGNVAEVYRRDQGQGGGFEFDPNA
jgi:hypothetical protein